MSYVVATLALVAWCVLVAAASRVGERLLTEWETGRGEPSADREGVTGRDGEARSVHPSGPAGCAPRRGPVMPGWPPSESPAA